RVGVEEVAAIGERVGRDVHDAHDECAGQPGQRCRQSGGTGQCGTGQGQVGAHLRATMRLMASARVVGSRSWPRTADVMVLAPGDPLGGVTQTVALRVLTDGDQQVAHCPAYALVVVLRGPTGRARVDHPGQPSNPSGRPGTSSDGSGESGTSVGAGAPMLCSL